MKDRITGELEMIWNSFSLPNISTSLAVAWADWGKPWKISSQGTHCRSQCLTHVHPEYMSRMCPLHHPSVFFKLLLWQCHWFLILYSVSDMNESLTVVEWYWQEHWMIVHQKSHMEWPGIEPMFLQQRADHYIPKPWHRLNLLDASVWWHETETEKE